MKYASDKLKNNYELIYLSIKSSKENDNKKIYWQYKPIISKEVFDKYKSIDKIYKIFKIYVNKGNNLKLYDNDYDLFIMYH